MDRTYNFKEIISNGDGRRPGPHPGFIQVSGVYYYEEEIQARLKELGINEADEIAGRLNGVNWIEMVRKKLNMPVHTYNTAVLWYNKFRLTYATDEYDYRDAAAAALFVAGKIEDTLKKSRDILCAAYNVRAAPSEQRTPDEPYFDAHSKIIVGIERLTLESASFDFRTRHPNELVMKFVKSGNFDKATVGLTAFDCCIDIFRTWAPIKQTRQTLAFACFELAAALNDISHSELTDKGLLGYSNWWTNRTEVLETLMDLLDLYIQNRTSTLVGPRYPDQIFLNIRILLNEEANTHEHPRNMTAVLAEKMSASSLEFSSSSRRIGNGTTGSHGSKHASSSQTRAAVGERGKDGTVRFMLENEPAEEENKIVAEYFGPPREVEVYEDEMD